MFNHCDRLSQGMGITSYRIDLEKDTDSLITYLKGRGMSDEDINERLSNNTFMLSSKNDDIWFWGQELLDYFFGELLE